MSVFAIKTELTNLSNATRAESSKKFFKCKAGEYSEGDLFIGVSVPQLRSLAKKHRDVSLSEMEELLHDPMHECRLLALFLMVARYKIATDLEKQVIVDTYLRNLAWVNNWDLVDSSAYQILGEHLLCRDRVLLETMAKSDHLWTQRIAMIATYAFIRAGQYADTFRIADRLLSHSHDLIHKAVGWMLREAGKRDGKALRLFLHTRYKTMPRTMLRYAIEKFPEPERKRYLNGLV